MTAQDTDLTEQVIEAFMQRVSDAARQSLSDSDFNELRVVVREALSEQKQQLIQSLENLVKQLRAETERAEREL
jgi:hypothetical protein